VIRRNPLLKLWATVMLAGLALLAGGGSIGVSGAARATKVSASSAPGVTKHSITIGMSFPETGLIASDCAEYLTGSEAYIDYVNAKGGVNGRKIDFDVLDDASSPSQDVANVKTLQAAPEFAQYLGCGTPDVSAMVPIVNADKIPWIDAMGSASLLYLPTKKYIYAVNPDYAASLIAGLSAEFKKFGPGSVYLVNYVIAGYQAFSKAIQKLVKAKGGTFVGESDLDISVADYTPVALKIKAAHPEYLVTDFASAQAAALVNDMAQQDALPTKRILGTTFFLTSFSDSVQSAKALSLVDSTTSTLAVGAPQAALCAGIISKYAPSGTAVDDATVTSCSEAQALVYGLQHAGKNPTRSSLLSAMNGMKNETFGILPPLGYSVHDHLGSTKIYIGKWVKGAFVIYASAAVDPDM
jgi:branched-chain amino acid transport system substrate-binding protein